MRENRKAIVLVSGGMDSLVSAAIAASENDELYFLHVNYGQRTEERELKSFKAISDFYHPNKTLIADLTYLKDIGGTSLINEDMNISTAGTTQGIPNTYVPFRNANILSVAVSWAEVIKATRIYIGVVEEDSSGYPDCREKFINSFNETLKLGTKPDTQIEIVAPINHKSKAEIIKIGIELNAPFKISWSCYQNNDKACGICDSCRLRLKAFREAGVVDPIPYADGVR
jgi:7-cyano-7-deazaguanine synthase